MSPKGLIAAAAVLVIALSPSVSECIQTHQEEQPHRWVLWAWVALAVVIAVAFGKQFLKGGP